MHFKPTNIEGLIEIFPKIFEDERGLFFESYQEQVFKANGIAVNFVQDNQSYSRKGVLRGLHFQKDPYAQGKLVRVITGKVLDVAVDLRRGSPTFGRHDSIVLDAVRNNMVYIPEGFAHGFVALEDSIFSYKCTKPYSKFAESGILWKDKQLGIDWGVTDPVVSLKDQLLPSFEELTSGIY